MNKYIRIMRLDHWIKQLFIFPGLVAAIIFMGSASVSIINILLGFLSTCFIASANYIINEWLDAEFDKFHPTKKNRSVVSNDLKPVIVYSMYAVCSVIGFVLAILVNKYVLGMEFWLWVMGVFYNVKPVRTKDIALLDVLSESVNNAIRLLIGWFVITDKFLPPSSIVFGYWMAGAFLMAIKRFAEYRMIGNPELAAKYRKSFKYYTEVSLLISAFFYAMTSVFFIGVFLIKYRAELLIEIPLMIGLYCYYFRIAFKEDSAAQKPEKLFREKGLMAYLAVLIVVFVILMIVDIPFIHMFYDSALIGI